MINQFRSRIRQARRQRQVTQDTELVGSSDLFDGEWYLKKYPDVALSGIDPLSHFLNYGGFEGRNPGPNFFSSWYLENYEDVRKGGMNPLLHYLKYGKKEGRVPGPPRFQLRRMYDYSKETNRIVFEEPPERIYLRRPQVIGEFSGSLEEGEALCPRPYVSVLEDVLVFGGRSLVLAEGKLVLSDELVDFNRPEFGKMALYAKVVDDDTVMLTSYKKSKMDVEEGILLSCGHDENYFHWLIECLPKLLLIDSLPEFKDVPLLIPSGLHKNLLAALERVNTNQRKLIEIQPEATCRVERLIFPSALSQVLDRYEGAPVFNVDIVLSHKWLRNLSECLTGTTDPDEKPWRKLFLARRNGYRLLANWAQMEQMLLEEGFEVVELSGATLDFQMELFSQAAVVISPTGAALTNMLFCRPGTKVFIFMSNHEVTNYYFWSNLGAVKNLDVTTIAGQRLFRVTNYYSVHDDYVLDPEFVREQIRNPDRSTQEKGKFNGHHTDILVDEKIPEAIKKATKIFVVGPPRSGTTLIYSMIAGGLFLPECTFVSNLMKVFDETYKFGDRERFNYYGHSLANLAEIFKKPIYDFLYTATSKVGGDAADRFIYKDPILTLYLEYFPLFFDDCYKVVLCVRDPRDVVSSMFNVLKRQHPDRSDSDLFDNTIDSTFSFYQAIHHIENAPDYMDKNKIIFIKYEDIVTGNHEVVQTLEDFLGFPINAEGINESIKGRLDESSPFYSENYGKAITTSPIGTHKNSLTAEQIAKVEEVFSFHMKRLGYE